MSQLFLLGGGGGFRNFGSLGVWEIRAKFKTSGLEVADIFVVFFTPFVF